MVPRAGLAVSVVTVAVLVGCAEAPISGEGIMPSTSSATSTTDESTSAPPSPASASPPSPESAPLPGMSRYVSPTYGWSIDYPNGWLVDSSDPTFVEIRDKDDSAMVGIHAVGTTVPLTDVVDEMLASQEQYQQEKGKTWVLVSRQPMSLPDGTPAIDVVVELGPGGRSRQLYVVSGDKAFAVDAETYTTLWDTFSEDFDRIVNSFTAPH